METQITVLKQSELCGRQFQVYGTAAEPLFLATDVAAIIEHSNVSEMLRVVDEDEKLTSVILRAGQNRECNFLTEEGLYEVLMQSRKPIAKQFKKGVKAILKEVRTTGGYIATADNETDEEIMARALVVAQRSIERKNERIKALESDNAAKDATIAEQSHSIALLKPKATYYDTILNNPHTLNATAIASDYGMTAIKFNKLLHSLGIQRKVGGVWIPFAKYIAKGYTKISTDPNPNSKHGNSFTYAKWTQKGRLFLYDMLKKHDVFPLIEKGGVA